MKNKTSVLFSFLGTIMFLFILIPILKLFFSAHRGEIQEAVKETEVISAISLSLLAAFYTTLIGFILGVPLAYQLARTPFRGKSLVEGVINLPLVIPHTAAGIALLGVFGRHELGGKFFQIFNLRFVTELPGIVIAMLFVSVPFLINAARDGFASVDPKLEKVARSLGANPWQVFWRISFPLASRNIFSGAILMWARGISEFGAVVILAYHPLTAPVLLYERFVAYGLKYAQPIALLLISICLVFFVSFQILNQQKKQK